MIPTPQPAPEADPLWVARMVAERFHRDDEGRPLREGRTPPDYLQPGEIEYRACPYPGSRHADAAPNRMMNVSALRQTSEHWDEIIAALGFLRTVYAETHGSYGPSVMDVWRVSQLGSALPWFFVLRGEPLPAYAAALSKATLGTGILAQRLMLKMLREQWQPPAAFDTPALLELAESTGTLIGATEVCSAPAKMIARFIDVIVNGAPSPTQLELPAIASLVAARDRVVSFGACYAAFKLAIWQYYQARRFLYADALSGELRPELRAAFQALMMAPCEPSDFYIIEPNVLHSVPGVLRMAWMAQLAKLHAAFAPDRSDRPVIEAVVKMAAAMHELDAPDPLARACAIYDRLDGLFADVVAGVEAGFRGAPYDAPIDAATRDRLLAVSPRNVFAALRG